MNLRLVFANLRLVIWPLCMAYAAFLLADTKSFSSLSVMITPHFSGRCLDFAWELCSLPTRYVATVTFFLLRRSVARQRATSRLYCAGLHLPMS